MAKRQPLFVKQSMAKFIFYTLAAILFLGNEAHTLPLSLNDCYQIALKERETLKQREAEIKAAEARYQLAIAEFYPELGIAGNQRIRDNENFGSLSRGTFNDPSTGLARSRTLGRTQFEGLVTFTQPLFRGFREFAVARASDAERASLDKQLERDKQTLYLDVAALYYQVLLFQEQEQSLAKGEKTFQDRIAELNQFIALGKAKESEVHAAEADLAQQRLSKERAKRNKEATREIFASLLRLDAKTLTLVPTPSISPPPALDTLIPRLRDRADIKASEYNEMRSRALITAEERRWWPSVSMNMTGFAVDDPDRNRDWEMFFQMSMPIFDGGRIDSRVAERNAELLRLQSVTAEQQRTAERDLREAYVRMELSRSAIKEAEALKAAREKNLRSQREDYSKGRVTNLDVINAMSMLQIAELELINTQYTYINDIAQVVVAAGEPVL